MKLIIESTAKLVRHLQRNPVDRHNVEDLRRMAPSLASRNLRSGLLDLVLDTPPSRCLVGVGLELQDVGLRDLRGARRSSGPPGRSRGTRSLTRISTRSRSGTVAWAEARRRPPAAERRNRIISPSFPESPRALSGTRLPPSDLATRLAFHSAVCRQQYAGTARGEPGRPRRRHAALHHVAAEHPAAIQHADTARWVRW